MSFLLPAALLVALLVGAPFAAHFLRRGRAKEVEFPAASLVPEARSTARQKARLEDRWLLALRALIVLSLALLGASPLMHCSRLAVARPGGASMAIALVVDDSLSMRAKTGSNEERFARAVTAARELLSQAREGDAISIVLAGRPARLALAASTDIAAAQGTLDSLEPADRSTDLSAALALARSTLDGLPHVEKRIVLLSDLGEAEPLDEKALQGVLVPLPELRAPYDDCGIVSAHVRSGGVEADVVCSGPLSAGTQGKPTEARKMRLELRVARGSATLDGSPGPDADQDKALGSVPVDESEAAATLRIDAAPLYRDMSVHLVFDSGARDAIAQDDVAPVIPPGSDLVIGALADPSKASVQTGGATILETALRALDTGARIEPLSVLPENSQDLDRFGALLIDDPPGLTPEVRSALQSFLERGGVALVFWGASLESAPLGSGFDPFLSGAPTWLAQSEGGVDPKSASFLGEAAESLTQLAAKGRVRLPSSPDTEVLARWSDGEPWLVERRVGRGLALSAGLPLSVSVSDFALRPGFLGILESVVQEAMARRGGRERVVGQAWEVPSGADVEGPNGKIAVQRAPDREQSFVEPPLRGRYRVLAPPAKEAEERFAVLDPAEIVRQPRPTPEATRAATDLSAVTQVDVSREIAFVVLFLGALELVVRALRRRAGATLSSA